MTLSIESAIGGGSLSLFCGGRKITGVEGPRAVSRAEDLLPNIDSLMDETGMHLSEIDTIAVSVGPGSFTGLRIGLSTAMGLSAALDKPLVGVSLFEAIGAKLSIKDPIVIVVPMGRSDICFQRVFGGAAESPSVGKSEDLATFLASNEIGTVATHSDLVPAVSALSEAQDREVLDLGSNMADYIGCFAPSQPNDLPVEPLYVQNPRFR